MALIISKEGSETKRVEKSNFDKEGYLQEYIRKNPEAIPIYEIQEDKRLFVVAREFPTESGPIDALAIDKDGDIYIVETKLYKNPDKRTVVAQALDYGASLWKHAGDTGSFIEQIDENIQSTFKMSFSEKVRDFFNLDEGSVDTLMIAIKQNLHDGNLKFVVLMDHMEERLKDLIIYVNQNSQFDIYAVELEYYKHEEYEIMIPKIYGVEVKKNVSGGSSGTRKRWDEDSFLADAKQRLSEKGFAAIEKLYRFCDEHANIDWGTGSTRGSFTAQIDYFSPKALFIQRSNGRLSFELAYTRRRTPDQTQSGGYPFR